MLYHYMDFRNLFLFHYYSSSYARPLHFNFDNTLSGRN